MSNPSNDPDAFLSLFGALGEDVHRAAALVRASGDQFSHRQFVRAAFAMQEAVTFGLKQMALHIDDDEHLLDASERMFLKEETYELRESGEVVPRALFIPMLRNIRFAFSTFANAQGLAFRLPVSDSHWLKLRTAIAVRNRLTHPKQPLDVQVSEDEYQTVRDANIWLVLQAYELLRAAADKDRERVTLLDQQLASIREERAEIARELRALLVKRAARKRTRFSDKKRPPAP